MKRSTKSGGVGDVSFGGSAHVSLRRHFFRSAGLGMAMQSVALLLGLASAVLAARMLGPTGLGQYAYALAVVGAVSIPAALGLPTAIVRFIAVYGRQGRWSLVRGLLRQSSLLAAGLATVLALLLAVTASKVQGLGNTTIWWLATPLIPILVLTNLRQKTLQGLDHPIAAQLPEQAVKYLFFLAMGGVLWFLDPEFAEAPSALMGAWLVASVFALLAGIILLRRLSPMPLRQALPQYQTKQWLATALPLLVTDSAAMLYGWTDIILLGMLRPPVEVGLYQVATRTAGLIVVFLGASNWVLAPWFARLHESAEQDRLQRIVTRTTRGVFVPSLVGYVIFVLAGRELLALFFGAAYDRAWGVLLILGGARLVDVAAGPVVNMMAMTGGQRALAAVIAVAALGNMFGCWLLIHQYGMYGAATSTALATIASNVVLAIMVRRRIGVRTTVFG